MSDERGQRRYSASGVRAAYRPDDPRISVVVCDVADGPLAARLRRYFPDFETLFIGHDREALEEAMRELLCVGLVAMTTCARISPPRDLTRALRTWPMASLIWFEQYTRPEQPRGKVSHLPAMTQLIGPFHDEVDQPAATIIEQAESDIKRCLSRARLGHRFAKHHGLAELATRLVVAVAMGIPEVRLDRLLGRSSDQIRTYRHRGIYEKLRPLGVRTMADLQNQLWGFESRLRAERLDDGSGEGSPGGK